MCLALTGPLLPLPGTRPHTHDARYLGFLLIIKNGVFGTRWRGRDQRPVHRDGGVRLHDA